jgi:hypothetical protein
MTESKRIVPGHRQGRIIVMHQSIPKGATKVPRWWYRCDCEREWTALKKSNERDTQG